MGIGENLPISYTSPVGESGIGVRAVTEHNSVIRVYAHEVSHKAAARLEAQVQGVEVESQRVEIRVMANEEGKVVAAGGETTSEMVNENGDSFEVRELALLSSYSGGGSTASAAFFGDSRRRMPQLFLFDSYGSRISIEGSLDRLALNASRPLIERNIQLSGTDRGAAEGLLNSLSSRLGELSGRVEKLGGMEPYINLAPKTSMKGILEASVTSSDADESSRTLRVASLARAKQASMDPIADNTAPLGLEGRFHINGVAINLESTDSLIDLETLINRGEDSNGNGRLDNIEDRNWNRELDSLEDRNGNGMLDTEEDLDADGIIEAGEDLNINGRLESSEDKNYNFIMDGGTRAHGVKAFRVEGNRLVMQSAKTDGLFEVEDNEGLLTSLGLVTTDLLGDTVFANEIFGGSKAVVEEGGAIREFPTNTIENYAQGIDLTLTGHFQFPVDLTFSKDASELIGVFSEFQDAFNAVQGQLNRMVAPGGIFRDDNNSGFMKSDLINAVRFEASPPPEVPAGLQDAGFSLERHRVSLDEASIRAADMRLDNGAPSPFDASFGLISVRNSLGQFGITSMEDAHLSIDKSLLNQLLEQDVKNAEEALGSSALVGRLRSVLEAALDPLGGYLSMARISKGEQIHDGFFEKIRKDAQLQSVLGASVNLVA